MCDILGRAKSLHDIFIHLNGPIEMAARSKKPKAVALVKRLTKKGIEKNTGRASTSHDRP